MNVVKIVASCLILALPAMVPAAGTEGETVNESLRALWVERTGTSVPEHLAADLAELATYMTLSDVAGLRAAEDEDNAVAYGDVWAICMSPQMGCSVIDKSGTFNPHCETYPVQDKLWIYRTTPAVLELEASGKAKGLWKSHTFHQGGDFTKATITGMSCVVYDDPHIMVVRTNGRAEFEP